MLTVPARQNRPASKPLAFCHLHSCNLSETVLLLFTQQPNFQLEPGMMLMYQS
jgi:hypothetical protein